MKLSLAANLALVLVFVGWLLSAYGVLSQMGDPSPDLPRAVITAHKRTSMIFLFTGIFCLLSSIWLSGFTFLYSKWHASVALLACVLPLVIYIGYILFRVL